MSFIPSNRKRSTNGTTTVVKKWRLRSLEATTSVLQSSMWTQSVIQPLKCVYTTGPTKLGVKLFHIRTHSSTVNQLILLWIPVKRAINDLRKGRGAGRRERFQRELIDDSFWLTPANFIDILFFFFIKRRLSFSLSLFFYQVQWNTGAAMKRKDWRNAKSSKI